MAAQETGDQGMTLSEGLALLNEFAAACLDAAQQELRSSGGMKGNVSLGYGMRAKDREPAISQYELTRQDTPEADKELDEIRRYAQKSGAEAVAVVTTMAVDASISRLFPGADAVLLVAAASPDGRVTIMRPYKHSPLGIVFGDPKIVGDFPIPLLDAVFPRE